MYVFFSWFTDAQTIFERRLHVGVPGEVGYEELHFQARDFGVGQFAFVFTCCKLTLQRTPYRLPAADGRNPKSGAVHMEGKTHFPPTTGSYDQVS